MNAVLHLSSGETFQTSQSLESVIDSLREENGVGILTFPMRDKETGEVGTKVIFMSHIVSITDY